MAWSDYGVSNSLDGFKLNSKYKEGSLQCGWREALIEAINERCDVTGVAKPYTELPKLHNSYDVTETIENKINRLIPSFVNHTDNGGNWDGQTSIPNWTKNDMLTQLGEAEINSSRLMSNISEWALQQYRLLNLMRWTQTQDAIEAEGSFYQKIGNDTTWAGAVANYNAAPWVFISAATNIAQHYTQEYFGNYSINRFKVEWQYENPYPFEVEIQLYGFFHEYTNQVIPNRFYENNDYTPTEDTFGLVSTNTFADSEIKNLNIGDIDPLTGTQPTISNSSKGWSCNLENAPDGGIDKVVYINKVVSSFEFQDNTI